MREFLRESIIDDFNDGLVAVTKGNFVKPPVLGVTLSRNEELDLVFELRSSGWGKETPERYPAGTVRAADEVVEFNHPAGWIGAARGVIARDTRSRSSAGETETIETYSAHSVELNPQRQVLPCYVIEWVSNLPSGFIWTEPVSFNVVETSTKSVGFGDAEICMTGWSKSGGGNKALHLKISGVDLYVVPSIERRKKDKGEGQIIYRTCPDQAFRDKVRTCISFVLGKPIVYLGHTAYCREWIPTFMRSVDAISLGGAVFKLPDLPPYPINDAKYANVIDQTLVIGIANALFDKFDAIKFNEISWSYWYAMCAPIHASAVHFGSLIEQLQNNSSRVIPTTRGQLLDDETWRSLQRIFQNWLQTANVDPDIRPILKSKISSLNQAPQNVVLRRLLNTMGLRTSEVEMKAWKHRNLAAHGGFSDDPVELILNSKVLRLLFHRMLAGITYCSNQYIDYYNLGHPVRALTEAVPGR